MAQTRKPELVRSPTALGVAIESVDAVLSVFRAVSAEARPDRAAPVAAPVALIGNRRAVARTLPAISASPLSCALLTIMIARQDRLTASLVKITG